MVQHPANNLPKNPYGSLNTIRNPAMFFGRTHILRRLYSAVADQQSISLVGPRRIGKSSVLNYMRFPQVQQHFAQEYQLQNHILIFLDLGSFVQKTRNDFFETVCTQFMTQGKEVLHLESLQEEYADDRFTELLDQIKEQGFHPVLLFDGFDTITRNPHFDPNFFIFLRAQANQGRVSYVTASIESLDRFCHKDIVSSPFFNIFSHCSLGPLTEEEARQLITVPASTIGCPFSEEEVDWILRLTGRHPFFIQRVCHYLFEEKYALSSARSFKLKEVKEQAYRELLQHFKYIWENSLTVDQQEDLRGAARRGASGIKAAHPELSESALFRKFVRETCNMKPLDITIDDMEKVLDHLNNTKYLGESDLRYLNLVYMQMQSENALATAIARGTIIRQILYKAVEELRPSGQPQEHEQEWRVYTILTDRYFKHRMKNDDISFRLGLSARQYFRVRLEAIEALLNVLFTMETASIEDSD